MTSLSSSTSAKAAADSLPAKRKAGHGEISGEAASEGSSSKKARPAETPQMDGKATAAENGDDEDDEEWLQFQREVLDAPSNEAQPEESPAASAPAPRTHYTTSANATIEAQPQLISRGEAEEGEDGTEAEPEEESEEDKRQRQAREEKEEILARLDEEQRQQDEAQERVTSLKSRLERIKAARAAKAKK